MTKKSLSSRMASMSIQPSTSRKGRKSQSRSQKRSSRSYRRQRPGPRASFGGRNIPVARGMGFTQSNQQLSRQYGTDFLTKIVVKSNPTSASDRILYSNLISPSAFPGTRIASIAGLWERYRYKAFRLRWVPAVPTTMACQFIIYEDTDPVDDPSVITDVDALIRQAASQAKARQFNFSDGRTTQLCQRKDDQLYYTGTEGSDPRQLYQGRFYVIQQSTPLNFNGESIPADIEAGSLYLDWVCEFQTQQINPDDVLRQLPAPASPTLVTKDTTLNWTQPDTTPINVATISSDGPFRMINPVIGYTPSNLSGPNSIIGEGIWSSQWAPTLFTHNGSAISKPAGTHTVSFYGSPGAVSNFQLTVVSLSDVNVSVTPLV